MTEAEKINMLKTLLKITDTANDASLSAYLQLSKMEIINWLGKGFEEVPERYVSTQIQSIVVAFNLEGIEGQTISIENSIHRHFKYTDMVDYIKRHVVPYVRV